MIAVCQKKYQDEYCFIIKPSPSNRKVHLVRLEQKPMIKEVIFVTNNHILVQFDHKFVPPKSRDNPRMVAEEQQAEEEGDF